jgi:hypothetical protein
MDQSFDAPGAQLGLRDVERRRAIEQRVGPVQECARLCAVVPQRFGQGDDAGQPLRPFAFIERQPGAALERRDGHDTVDELRRGPAGRDRPARDELQRLLRKAGSDDTFQILPGSDAAAENSQPPEDGGDLFNNDQCGLLVSS